MEDTNAMRPFFNLPHFFNDFVREFTVVYLDNLLLLLDMKVVCDIFLFVYKQ